MPATYSLRTICPKCLARIRLEDVRFTSTFPCPHCGATIRVSQTYMRIMSWAIWVLTLLALYAFGIRWWVLLLCWLPLSALLVGLWAYAGKYCLPPRLERCEVELPSILGLGPPK
jgi:hypothetical protein